MCVPGVRGGNRWARRGMKETPTLNRWLPVALAIAVLIIHAAPLAVWYARHHRLLVAVYFDEILYEARVVDAYRGGNMSSPFLAGHEDAPDFKPQLAERLIALTARLLHVSPLQAIAAGRIVIPLAIYWLLFALARNLGISATFAAIAG